MQFAEFEACKIIDGAPLPDESLVIEQFPDGKCIVNGQYPMVLEAVSSLYPRMGVIGISDESGSRIGDLLTCKDEEFASVSTFSALYLAAYLAEVTRDNYGVAGRFKHDYLLLDKDRLQEYSSEFLESSAIWGGFAHVQAVVSTHQPASNAALIIAKRGITLPSQLHREAANRSVVQPQAFERFLKLYHILELSFDLEVVNRIKNIPDDLNGIGQILSNYSSKEINRLSQIVATTNSPDKIVRCLAALCSDAQWHTQIQSIFFDFGKDGNPLDGKGTEFIRAIASSGFSPQILIDIGIVNRNANNALLVQRLEELALRLSTYWIYRVRCSIAHSKIGEYVMTSRDEPFVALFAEPLLRCVLETTLK